MQHRESLKDKCKLRNSLVKAVIIPTGRKDSSGLRFFYTSNIRRYDAGVLTVGEVSLPYMIIPPKQKSWLTVGYCPKECSQVRCKIYHVVAILNSIAIFSPPQNLALKKKVLQEDVQ